MEAFIGTIMTFGFNFPPNGWALCQGQIIPIAQYTALFSLLGTTYGGNGQTTFALPDFRGRVPIGVGQGPGLSNISQGEVSGAESVTLIVTNLPVHTHTAMVNVPVTTANASTEEPAGNIVAGQANNFFAAPSTANGSMGGTTMTLQPAGSNQPFASRSPYLGLNFSLCMEGIFPSRN